MFYIVDETNYLINNQNTEIKEFLKNIIYKLIRLKNKTSNFIQLKFKFMNLPPLLISIEGDEAA